MRNTVMRFAPLLLVIVLVMGFMAGAVACTRSSPAEPASSKPILTVTKGSVSKSLTMADLKAMPVTEWVGCLRHENGVIEGPFRGKGVAMLDLCDIVGGLDQNEAAEASASDGFVHISYDNIMEKDFKTYSVKTGEKCSHGDVVVLLAYEQDGQPLDKDAGPLRVMILAGEDVATEGYLWMKRISSVKISEWTLEGTE